MQMLVHKVANISRLLSLARYFPWQRIAENLNSPYRDQERAKTLVPTPKANPFGLLSQRQPDLHLDALGATHSRGMCCNFVVEPKVGVDDR
jgi:hypothetical protein